AAESSVRPHGDEHGGLCSRRHNDAVRAFGSRDAVARAADSRMGRGARAIIVGWAKARNAPCPRAKKVVGSLRLAHPTIVTHAPKTHRARRSRDPGDPLSARVGTARSAP